VERRVQVVTFRLERRGLAADLAGALPPRAVVLAVADDTLRVDEEQ
jgi:hypothetical protein